MKRRWLLAVIAGVSALLVYAQLSRDPSQEFLSTVTGRAFMQAYGALKTNYLNDVDDTALIQGAINGMITALGDPYTYYSDPAAAARRNQDLSGSFEGIGAVLTPHNRSTGRGVEILTVYRDGPAWNAGVERGDIFLEVDGVDVRDFTPSEVADLVRGPGGTLVTLKMLRPGLSDPIEFAILRGTIDIVSVESTVLPDNVGYLSLSTFGNQRLYDQMLEHLDKLLQAGVTSLILDLRDNGGGLLSQGVLVADEFLNSGDIVFQRARGVTQRYASADPRALDLPMVVLVNKNSASASEIVAGALQENGRALIIGESTFGKGVAQSVISLPDGGQLAYVSFEWLTPNRNSISETGVTPDVFVEDTRFPSTVSIEGRGLSAGQTVEISVDGVVIGTVTSQEDGTFNFVTLGPRREVSSVQGEALVDLEADQALRVAFDTLQQVVAGTWEAAESQ
jgi:carboxyl-terminal processing protease